MTRLARHARGTGSALAGRPRSLRAILATSLVAVAAALASCSTSSGGLIPASDAGPLRGDFEAIARAAENGNGQCSETEAALSKTELDFAALPSSVSAELRSTLREGIANLKKRALVLCTQPLPQATTTTPAETTSPPAPGTQSTTTKTTPATPAPTTPSTPSPGGGTPSEESPAGGSEGGGGEEEPHGHGNGDAGGEAGGPEVEK